MCYTLKFAWVWYVTNVLHNHERRSAVTNMLHSMFLERVTNMLHYSINCCFVPASLRVIARRHDEAI